jgi:hypothetical protein
VLQWQVGLGKHKKLYRLALRGTKQTCGELQGLAIAGERQPEYAAEEQADVLTSTAAFQQSTKLVSHRGDADAYVVSLHAGILALIHI